MHAREVETPGMCQSWALEFDRFHQCQWETVTQSLGQLEQSPAGQSFLGESKFLASIAALMITDPRITLLSLRLLLFFAGQLKI